MTHFEKIDIPQKSFFLEFSPIFAISDQLTLSNLYKGLLELVGIAKSLFIENLQNLNNFVAIQGLLLLPLLENSIKKLLDLAQLDLRVLKKSKNANFGFYRIFGEELPEGFYLGEIESERLIELIHH